MPQHFQSTPSSRSRQTQYRTDVPPADIADSILSNPWTAGLAQADGDLPQLYSTSTALTRVGLGSWAPDKSIQQQRLRHLLQERPESQAEDNASHDEANSHSDGQSDAQTDVQSDAQSGCQSEARSDLTDQHGDGAQDRKHSPHRGSDRPNEHGRGRASRSLSQCSQQSTGSNFDRPSDSCSSVQKDKDDETTRRTPDCRKAWQAGSEEKAALRDKGKVADQQGQSRCEDRAQRSPLMSAANTHHAIAHASSLGRGKQPHTSSAHVVGAMTADSNPDSAFTSKQGLQQTGAGQLAAAPRQKAGTISGSPSGRQRRLTSWVGDFGHLQGPRFTKQQGRAWATLMQSQRDKPDESPASPQPTAEVLHHRHTCSQKQLERADLTCVAATS